MTADKKKEALNLFELRPRKNAEWEEGAGGEAVVLVPKFGNVFLKRWLAPYLRRPFIRVKLDRYGSFVWARCDGKTRVGEIAEAMSREFGEPIEAMAGRLQSFINQLERGDLIIFEHPEEQSVQG